MLLVFAGCSVAPQWHPGVALSAGPWTAGPVAVPEKGALLGAWVRPQSYTQPGRLAAVADFEALLGRELDIVHTYRRMHEEIGTESDVFFASRATLMVSWAGASSSEIVSGSVDEGIRWHAKQIRALETPVLLRVRWEMDRPNLAASVGSPPAYIAAWRHVREVFASEGANNVSWVFCPTAEGFAEERAAAYYPGDDTVDWTCVDVYAGRRLRPISELLAPFLAWAAQRPKPIMIGEYGVARAWSSLERRDWITEAAGTFQANPQIKAVLYFESNPDERTSVGEFALSGDHAALDAFRQTALDPYFRSGRLRSDRRRRTPRRPGPRP